MGYGIIFTGNKSYIFVILSKKVLVFCNCLDQSLLCDQTTPFSHLPIITKVCYNNRHIIKLILNHFMNNHHNPNISPLPAGDLQPQTLTTLGLVGTSFSATVRYENTQINKKGLTKILGRLLKKLPLFDDKPITLDIDLACLALDKQHQLLETIWYGKLRNTNQSIRHYGDALFGARNFDESLATQEEIHIRPDELDTQIQHLIFIASANRSLKYAQKGSFSFIDNEEHTASQIDTDKLPKGCRSMLLWHLNKKGTDWQLHAPTLPLTGKVDSDTPIKVLAEIQSYLNNQ